MKRPVEPIHVLDLFPAMRAELLRVLHSLFDEAWQAPTACAGWSVKDVASHILSDEIAYLSRRRDRDGVTFEVSSWDELLRLINEHNELWVKATRHRVSRKMLMALLEFTGPQFYEHLASIDPQALSGPVSWAGDAPAPMWLQIAREYTEYWMHHQHICEAAGRESLKDRRFLHPLLSTFVHALPHTYRDVDAPPDTTVCFTVTGAAADSWFVVREPDAWKLYADTDRPPASTVTLDGDTAWRLFTKGIGRDEAAARAVIEGDAELGAVLLDAVAIIA